MNILEINGKTGRSSIIVGENLRNMHRYIDKENIIIITDENVNSLYGDKFESSCNIDSEVKELKIIEIGIGEKIKTLETVEEEP